MKRKLFLVACCVVCCTSVYFLFTASVGKSSLSVLAERNVEALVRSESTGSVPAIICYDAIDTWSKKDNKGYYTRCGDNTPTEIVACKNEEYGVPALPDRCLPNN